MPISFKDLAGESVTAVMEYLRATDLVSLSEVNKSIFQKSLISKAVAFQLDAIYPISSSPIKERRLLECSSFTPSGVSIVEYGCDTLYICEVKAILFALGCPNPSSGKGYWVSTSWVANAKKYYEALNLPEIRKSGKKTTPKKITKIRQRRGSDALPPWPSMNAEVTCEHENLALTKGLRSKKRLIDSRSWFFLRKFYPSGPTYKSTTAKDCPHCLLEEDAAKSSASAKREVGLKSRQSQFLIGPLALVASRKSGVPSHLLSQKMIPVSESEWEAYALSFSKQTEEFDESLYLPHLNSTQPLRPGLYNLVSKSWLKSWRNYNKDPSVSSLPPVDCTKMLCHSHGLLVIPPHVEEYLVGVRRSLLGGLGLYPGDVVEILCAEEWDALQASLRSFSDFSVRFCLDGDNISWNLGVCSTCCPFSYGPSR